MLCDEVRTPDPVHVTSFSNLETKKKESAELAIQVEAWIASGGKINGVSEQAKSIYHFNDSGREQADRSRENNRKKCVKASMKSKFNPTAQDNIYHSDANKDKFVVIISKYISRQFDYIHQAVNHRDFYLRKLENAGNN